MSVPFEERGGWVRGCLDLLSGRYPRFVFGGRVGTDLLPVFHFHDVTPEDLEPKFRYLADNGYRTTTADEMAAYARRQVRFNESRVALCFDDAWASLWTVVKPLLERYGLTAITYAIPARIDDASACRPTTTGHSIAEAGPPFVTWPELIALHRSGIVDVQCHTETHSMVFCSTRIAGFVTPSYSTLPMLNRPQLSPLPALRFVEPEELGAPLYECRSRMSDAHRVTVPIDAHLALRRARGAGEAARASSRAPIGKPSFATSRKAANMPTSSRTPRVIRRSRSSWIAADLFLNDRLRR